MSAPTKLVSFYSFKGGTGRSTSLANVAHALAEEGNKVGCMDLDLAAPGLHMIFPEIGPVHEDCDKIHYYVNNKDELSTYDIDNYIIDVGKRLSSEPDGELFLVPGEIDAVPDGESPRKIMKDAFSLRKDFMSRRGLDYLLLDSRSGLTNQMVPLFDEVDVFLTFHKWTYQHKRGTFELARWLNSKSIPSPDTKISVASNIPNSVDDSNIADWAMDKMYLNGFSDYEIINSSEILRKGEEIVALDDEHEDTQIVGQYQELADKIKEA
jgi:MinD-like ATPase involved in chromosome partitioning or flagellar assembly